MLKCKFLKNFIQNLTTTVEHFWYIQVHTIVRIIKNEWDTEGKNVDFLD